MGIKTIERGGIKFSFLNEEEFELIYNDVFKKEEYPFITKKINPFILDCGSHIGLATLYFKSLYPQAKIICFEPNPVSFKLLEKNVKQNNLKYVNLINAAISSKEGEIDFYIEKDLFNPWGWGDSAVINRWYSKKKNKTIKVKSVRLSTFIKNKIDLIKLDVEGLEGIILKEIKGKLSKIKQIMMEFHGSSTNLQNDPYRILSLLKENEFKYEIKQDLKFIDEKEIKRGDPYWLLIYAKNISNA